MDKCHGTISENDEEVTNEASEKKCREQYINLDNQQEILEKLIELENTLDNFNIQMKNFSTINNDLDKHYQEINAIHKNISSMSGFHTYINGIYHKLEKIKNQISEQEILIKEFYPKQQQIEEQLIKKQCIKEQIIDNRIIKKENHESDLPFVFTFAHLRDFLTIEDKNLFYKRFYKSFISLFLIGILIIIDYLLHLKEPLSTIKDIDQNLYFKYSSINFWYKLMGFILAGYLSNLALAFYSRRFIMIKLLSKKEYKHFKSNKLSWNILFSPDLHFSTSNKDKIKSKFKKREYSLGTYNDIEDMTPNQLNYVRIYNRTLIQQTNWSNVIISLLIIIISISLYICIIFFDWLEIIPFKGNISLSLIFLQWLLAFLIIRLISRGIEVIVSFYKDVVRTDEKLFFRKSPSEENSTASTILIQDYKNSLLLPKARISLAVHSLAEFNILFATAYYIFYTALLLIKDSAKSIPFLENLLYSSSIGVFNISYSKTSNILLNGMHYWQITISCVLILIAIAQYMGLNKPISQEEQLLYKHVQQFNLNQKEASKFKKNFMNDNAMEREKLLSFYTKIKSSNNSKSNEIDEEEGIKPTDNLF